MNYNESLNNGLVLQFIGDEIEAVFGAPLQLSNHSIHAVNAAIEMRKQLVLVNGIWVSAILTPQNSVDLKKFLSMEVVE